MEYQSYGFGHPSNSDKWFILKQKKMSSALLDIHSIKEPAII
jgi:hypothetical protein